MSESAIVKIADGAVRLNNTSTCNKKCKEKKYAEMKNEVSKITPCGKWIYSGVSLPKFIKLEKHFSPFNFKQHFQNIKVPAQNTFKLFSDF